MRVEPLDTLLHTETPEGLQLTLRPAGIAPRAYALLIDWGIRFMMFSVLAGILGTLPGIGGGVYLITYFVLEWFYPVFFELTPAGATPGKRLLHLQVVMDNGLPVTPGASLLRNLLRVADFLPFAFGFGLATMLWRPDFKRLGDLAAGTLVVYGARPVRGASIPDGEPLPPETPLSADALVAIVGLATRAERLTPERVEELATLLPDSVLPRGADVLRSRSGRVFGLARWLVGHRTQ